MIISYKDKKYPVECLKFCKTLDSVRIFLFRNLNCLMDLEYIVAVRGKEDTLYFHHFNSFKSAIDEYLNHVCKYA